MFRLVGQQIGLDGQPGQRWRADPMRGLDELWRRGAGPLGTRGERLQDGLAVRLGVGELVDQVSRTGDRAADALALVGQVVTRCGLQGHVRCTAPHRRTRGGTPDQLLVFHDRDDAADARRALLEEGLVGVQLGGREVRVGVQACLPHLDPDTTVITIYRLGFEYAREGVVEAILAAAGYGPESASVQAAFIGDLPASCIPWAGGPSPIGRADVIIAYVRAPPGDALLERLPRTFEQGWDDPPVDIRVRTRYCRQDPLAPEGQQHDGQRGGTALPPPGIQPVQGLGGQRSGSFDGPPPPPALPPRPRYDPLGMGGGGSAPRGTARVPCDAQPPAPPRTAQPLPMPPDRAVRGGMQREAATSRTAPRATPMEVEPEVPEGALAEACFALLEDYCEGVQHSDCRAIVAAVARQHQGAWEACAHGSRVPAWCQSALVTAAQARCPDAVISLPGQLEQARAGAGGRPARAGHEGCSSAPVQPLAIVHTRDRPGGSALRTAVPVTRTDTARRNPSRRARGQQVSYGPQGHAGSPPPGQGGAGR